MAEPSGALKPGNGAAHANGKLNNGKPVKTRTTARQRRGFMAWAVSLIARFVISHHRPSTGPAPS